jgi:hypothetical protein
MEHLAIVNPTNGAGVIAIDNTKTGRAKHGRISHGLSRVGLAEEFSSLPSDGLSRSKVARKAQRKSRNPKDIKWNKIGGWAKQMHSVENEITEQRDAVKVAPLCAIRSFFPCMPLFFISDFH